MEVQSFEKTSRVYLDHAATSWPKPPGVLEAFVEFEKCWGTSAGRSATRAGGIASQSVETARTLLAELIGARSECIAFCTNGTMALNAAILGMLQPGDHAIATAADHNSVLRPLELLKEHGGIDWTCVSVDERGVVSIDDLRSAIRPNTRLICSTHASNVTGALQPIEAVGELARERGIPFLLDAAQTIGYLPLDVQQMPIDLLAAPGHKGLGGMLGTGFLYLNPFASERFRLPWIGGTGSRSESLLESIGWVEGIESGNRNTPAIVSLGAGIQWLQGNRNDSSIASGLNRSELARLFDRLLTALRDSQLFAPVGRSWELSKREEAGECVPLVSVVSDLMSPQDWCSVLDSSFGIETRAGLHCAGQIHSWISTIQHGGTLRFSLGHTSTDADLDRLTAALKEFAEGSR